MKLCKYCLILKDDNDFGKMKKNQCKECERKVYRERYKKNSDKIKKRSSLYQENHYTECRKRIEDWRDNNREKVRKQNRQSYQRNKDWYKKRLVDPKKKKARYLLNLAVASKQIIKPEKCERCNNNLKLSGHHKDYNKPYDVKWLCGKCHKIEDTE